VKALVQSPPFPPKDLRSPWEDRGRAISTLMGRPNNSWPFFATAFCAASAESKSRNPFLQIEMSEKKSTNK
jgi:hypothetical protein